MHTTRRAFIRRAATMSGATLLGWPARLTWAMEPHAAPDPLTLLYYTDIHARVEWETPDAMMMAAEAMNAHHPDLVLCGGDMITDGYSSSPDMVAARWDAYLKMHHAIRPTPVSALGNHDIVGVEPEDGTAPATDFRADFRDKLSVPLTYKSLDHHGYHVILLDSIQVTHDDLKYRGYIDEIQMEWLEADLAAVDPATPIIVVCHMPLMTSFFDGAQVPPNRGVMNNREVLALFANHRLLAVLQGHLHVNEMLRWNNTTFITGGAVCGKWWRGSWYGTGEGFGVLRLHQDRVDWSYHTYGWTARRPPGV